MSIQGQSSWSRFFEEFQCPECGCHDAYRSRKRGFFEKHILSFVMRPVRCDRCSHRSYAFRSVPVQERVTHAKPQPQNQPAPDAKPESRIA